MKPDMDLTLQSENMSAELRNELSRQTTDRRNRELAVNLTMDDIKAATPRTPQPDELLSPAHFSARLLGLNERSSYVLLSWAANHAQHVPDQAARNALITHVRRVALLAHELDPQSTRSVRGKAALQFAEAEGWVVDVTAVAAPESEQRQDRRFARLRQLGGDRVRIDADEWRTINTSGSGAFQKLVAEEKTRGCKPNSEKSVRDDLTEAARRERVKGTSAVMRP